MRVAHLWHRRCYGKIAILSREYRIMKTKLLTVLLLSTALAASACSGGGNASSSEPSSSSSSSSSHVVVTYQINYFLNGGVNNAKNASYYKSNNPSIPLHPATKDGYSFIGWYTTATFIEGTLLTSIPANSTGDINLYAKWNDGNEYKVTLDPKGGVISPNEVTVKYNERYNIPNPLRDGYSFKNWVDENNQAFPGTGTWNIASDKALSATWDINQYTITYNLNGGTNNPSNPINYNYENEDIVLEDASKTGYTFLGWYKTSSFDEDSKISTIPTHSYGDITLYAKWNDGNKYTVTLNADGGTISPEQVEVKYKQAYNIPAPSRDGYSFTGWVDESSEAFPATGTWEFTTDKTLKATWNLNQYSIAYNLNGGTNNPSNPSSYSYESDEIVLANPSKTGYTFLGWYTTSTFDEQSVITSIPNNSTGDVTLYAKWNDGNQYTVTLDPNGGNVNPEEVNVQYDHAYNLPTPTRDGYSFAGWVDTNSELFPISGTWELTTNKELTATWNLDQYSISYELNGGTNNPSNPATYNYESDSINLASPSRTGYTFQGWYTTSTFEEQSVITTIPNHSTGDVTLYAKWEIVNYDITYNLAGGTNNPNNPATYNYEDDDIVLLEPSKTGYAFTGWVDANSNPVAKINKHSTGDVAVTATWEIVNYDISYELNGGINGDNPSTYNYESSTIVLANPSKTGYTFLGWYTTSTFEEESVITSIPNHSTGDVALYAKWNDGNEYTITLNPNGGSVNPTQVNVKYDNEYNLPAPTKTGYTFTGWVDESSQAVSSNGTWNVDSSKTLTATWEITQYSITYELDGGTNNPSNPATYNYESDSINLADPSKTGYTFLGWYTTSTFDPESVITSIANHSTGDKKLYAKWEIITYSITYELNGGTNGANPATYSYEDSTISLKDPSKTGYSFQGWFTTSTFEEESVITSIPNHSIGNITLYAKWEIVNYSITYELNDGTNNPSNPSSFTYESDAITLLNPSKYGYAFVGWYTTSTFEEESVITTIPNHSTGDVTLYAKWGNLPGLENLTYTLDNNKNITITGVVNKSVTSIVIPGSTTYNEITYTITKISGSILSGCNSLTSLTVPFIGESRNPGDGKLNIGYFFGAPDDSYAPSYVPSSLKTVVIGEGLTTLSEKAFYKANMLETIVLPSTISYIGDSVFYGCSKLVNLNIPSGVTNIRRSVFVDCSSLQSLELPGTDYIRAYLFQNCSSLKYVKIGNYGGQQRIEHDAFDGCTKLEYLIIPASMYRIYEGNFADVPAGFKVFYEGTSSTTWNSVVTSMSADEKAKATVYYYSETEPAEAGNYWHYVDDVPTIW